MFSYTKLKVKDADLKNIFYPFIVYSPLRHLRVMLNDTTQRFDHNNKMNSGQTGCMSKKPLAKSYENKTGLCITNLYIIKQDMRYVRY